MVSLPLDTFPSESFSSFRSKPALQPLPVSELLPSSSMVVSPVPETLKGALPLVSAMSTSERVIFKSSSVLLMTSITLLVVSPLPLTMTSSSFSFTVSFWVTLAVPSPLASIVMLPSPML